MARKISSGYTLTGGGSTSYFAGNINRMNLGKHQDKPGSPTKEPPSSASEDEQSEGKITGAHKPKYAKRKPSEQHGSHATSLLHQLYEKKHQMHLQQLQQSPNPGQKSFCFKSYLFKFIQLYNWIIVLTNFFQVLIITDT